MMIRGQFDTDWNRADEVHGVDCSRNGDGVPCDFYFIVTDHLGKPAVMLDSQGRVTGAADYDPLGYPNRVTLHAKQTGTDRWYANNLAGSLVATMRQPVDTGTNVRVRPRFHVVDTEDGIGKTGDYVEFTDTQGQQLISDIVQGHHKGPVVGPWITTAQTTDVQVRLVSDEANCCPDSGSDRCDPHMACSYCPASYFSGTCNGANYPYLGVVVEGYEYQRYQQGAAPVWTPLRFPGHYYDEESDLFENWNRYYDPSIGRYLQPEPMMAYPNYVASIAASGIQINPYAYAANNPVNGTDPNGLYPVFQGRWTPEDMERVKAAFAQLEGDSCAQSWFKKNWERDPFIDPVVFRTEGGNLGFEFLTDLAANGMGANSYWNRFTDSVTLMRRGMAQTDAQLVQSVMHELNNWAADSGGAYDNFGPKGSYTAEKMVGKSSEHCTCK